MTHRLIYSRFRGYPQVVADMQHPINRAASAWYSPVYSSRAIANLIPTGTRYPATGGVATFGPPSQYTPLPWFASGTNAFIDLNPSSRFLQAADQPGATFSWISKSNASTNYQGVACLMIQGNANPFVIGQANDASSGGGNFGHLWCGMRNSATSTCSWNGPPAVNANKENVFVLVVLHALNSLTKTDYLLYWGGPGGYGSAPGDGMSSQTANAIEANYFGYDGNTFDAKWSGMYDNLRVWNRPLAPSEAWSVINNPRIGARRATEIFLPMDANPFKPWTAMPTGWLS